MRSCFQSVIYITRSDDIDLSLAPYWGRRLWCGVLHPHPGHLPYDEDLAFAEFVDDMCGFDCVEDYINECFQFVGENSSPRSTTSGH